MQDTPKSLQLKIRPNDHPYQDWTTAAVSDWAAIMHDDGPDSIAELACDAFQECIDARLSARVANSVTILFGAAVLLATTTESSETAGRNNRSAIALLKDLIAKNRSTDAITIDDARAVLTELLSDTETD